MKMRTCLVAPVLAMLMAGCVRAPAHCKRGRSTSKPAKEHQVYTVTRILDGDLPATQHTNSDERIPGVCRFAIENSLRALAQARPVAGNAVLVRARPSKKVHALATADRGELLIYAQWGARVRGVVWLAVTTFLGVRGWILDKEAGWADALDYGFAVPEEERAKEALKKRGRRRPRVGTWCVHSGADMWKRVERILDVHEIDIALLQCVPVGRIGQAGGVFGRKGVYGVVAGPGASSKKTVVLVYRQGVVQMRKEAGVVVPGYRDVLAREYDVTAWGRNLRLVNVQWPEAGRRTEKQLRRMPKYLLRLKSQVRDGVLVAGTWPTGRIGPMRSYDAPIWVVRRVKAAGIWMLPVARGCSWYERGLSELTQYFMVFGKVDGLSRKVFSEVWGMCQILKCLDAAESSWRRCKPLVISGNDCPVVVGMPAKSEGQFPEGRGEQRPKEPQETAPESRPD